MAISNFSVDDTIRGSIAPGYERVGDVFRGFIDNRWDTGAGVSVYVRGEPVVRLTGGARITASDDPHLYDDRTIQLVASATKFAESLCVMLLVDRGLLRYDDRIVDHWPEFAGGHAGKEQVTVRQLMMHRAGLPVFERKLGDDELFDHDARARFLERQPQVPGLFEPEAEWQDWRASRPAPPQAYHAVSRGLYSSELLRRVDPKHRTMGVFFRAEVADPFAIDFWIGLPDEYAARISATRPDPTVIMRLMAGDIGALIGSGDPRYALHGYEVSFLTQLLTAPESIPSRALDCLAPTGVAPQELANHPKLRGCELGSSSGFGSADALARLAVLVAAGGSLGGAHLFASGDTLPAAIEPASEYAVDSMMLTPVEFTQGGFGRFVDETGTTSIGWGGAGGQMVRFIPELDLALGYVTNTLGSRMAMNDPRGLALLAAAAECCRHSE